MDIGIAGKVSVIVGAGQGIGRATVKILAQWGAKVVAVDIDPESLNVTVSETKELGGAVEPYVADACKEDQVVKLFEHVSLMYNRVDILVNLVGGGGGGKFTEITSSQWDSMFEFNVKSAFLCSREAVHYMAASGGGRIINVASVAGQTSSLVRGAHYSASKAAVIGLTRHMGREFAPMGINVNAIAPSMTLTARIEKQMTTEKRKAMLSRIPLGRLATPEDQAGPILFLASSLSNYITGVTIDVSGGMLLG